MKAYIKYLDYLTQKNELHDITMQQAKSIFDHKSPDEMMRTILANAGKTVVDTIGVFVYR